MKKTPAFSFEAYEHACLVMLLQISAAPLTGLKDLAESFRLMVNEQSKDLPAIEVLGENLRQRGQMLNLLDTWIPGRQALHALPSARLFSLQLEKTMLISTTSLQARMLRKHLILGTLDKWLPYTEGLLKDVSMLAWDLWQIDEDFYRHSSGIGAYSKITAEQTDKQKRDVAIRLEKWLGKAAHQLQLSADIMNEIMLQQWDAYHQACKKAGFWHSLLPAYPAQFSQTRRWLRFKAMQTRLHQRRNTFFALADDWKLNQEIYLMRDQARRAFWQLRLRLDARQQMLDTILDDLSVLLSEGVSSLGAENIPDLRKQINTLRYSLVRKIQTELNTRLEEWMSGQSVPLAIDEMSRRVEQSLDSIQGRRVIVPRFEYGSAYEDKALQSVNITRLIRFEYLSAITESSRQSRVMAVKASEEMRNLFAELSSTLAFNLESALASMDESGDEQAGLEMAVQGLSRAIFRFETARKKIQESLLQITGQIEQSHIAYEKALLALRENEKVLHLRYRIMRGQALGRGKRLKEQGLQKGQILYEKATACHRLVRRKLIRLLNEVRERLGVKAAGDQISLELSDFLATGETAMKELPYVYRRLFYPEPLSDTRFYLPRTQQMKLLKEAWEKWQQGSYVSVLITGEKGSGLSSMLRIFSRQYWKDPVQIHFLDIPERITRVSELTAFLGRELLAQPFDNTNELADALVSRESRVVVLEGLQRLFIRKSGGFFALNALFSLISASSRKVFWCCSCSLYASLFLEKSQGLYGYFPVHISLPDLKQDEIASLILRRHNASGYSLVFEQAEEGHFERSYKKMSPDQRQAQLQKNYFSDLNRLTHGNISFALLIWLRSTAKLTGTHIHLRSLKSLNFGFLHSLDQDTLFGLYALIIHDQLTAGELAQVLHISAQKSALTLMRLSDRGIVNENQKSFSINPLLYRQTVEHLKDRNIIH